MTGLFSSWGRLLWLWICFISVHERKNGSLCSNWCDSSTFSSLLFFFFTETTWKSLTIIAFRFHWATQEQVNGKSWRKCACGFYLACFGSITSRHRNHDRAERHTCLLLLIEPESPKWTFHPQSPPFFFWPIPFRIRQKRCGGWPSARSCAFRRTLRRCPCASFHTAPTWLFWFRSRRIETRLEFCSKAGSLSDLVSTAAPCSIRLEADCLLVLTS